MPLGTGFIIGSVIPTGSGASGGGNLNANGTFPAFQLPNGGTITINGSTTMPLGEGQTVWAGAWAFEGTDSDPEFVGFSQEYSGLTGPDRFGVYTFSIGITIPLQAWDSNMGLFAVGVWAYEYGDLGPQDYLASGGGMNPPPLPGQVSNSDSDCLLSSFE